MGVEIHIVFIEDLGGLGQFPLKYQNGCKQETYVLIMISSDIPLGAILILA
ncbi:hypothetical protein MBAV_006287 [Candidatus Magnetobacterium bavaricum]|uniref:Uncharacterized protein n=1 Tax=Candidatus Magnetobacterium bavaricum TaxID=29290 RepID=A0A0F3GLF5_9BACT|nr:hypothetical protein MBAV_006287 [Candidatus Magnetobacterium bavaricum]